MCAKTISSLKPELQSALLIIYLLLQYIFQSFPYPEYQKVGEVRQYVPLLMLYVVILTSLILSVPLISNIIDEKETGVKVNIVCYIRVKLVECLIYSSYFNL